jgi:AAA+ superfamily predicted ATPase
MNDTLNRLENMIRARYPIVAVLSHEETRVMSGLEDIARSRRMALYSWSFVTGWKLIANRTECTEAALPGFKAEETIDPGMALNALMDYPVDQKYASIFVMRDLHTVLGDKSRPNPKIERFLREIAARFEVSRHSLILLSPDFSLPTDLEKTISVLDYPLPSTSELSSILSRAKADIPETIPVKLNGSADQVINSMRGLTAFEAASALRSGIVSNGELSDGVIPFIIREKSQIIKKSGVLEYYDNVVTMQDVGGLDTLKAYATRKRAAFSTRASDYGLDTPRGVLLVGVPGTGKSLSAKAIAGAFQMPLLRMDVGALMGGLVGQSESNTRQALKVAEAVAPAVLWIDEIEKALGGSGGERDGGTSQRVFGTILTWMQEKTAPVYVVATANDITALKPELVSRFDDVIFVDLPARKSRAEILTVHLAKRHQNPAQFDLDAVSDALWGYSGREIERVVRSAIEEAFCSDAPLTTDHLLRAANELVPTSVTMKDQIDKIRAWAETSQARQAAAPLEARVESRSSASASRMIDL